MEVAQRLGTMDHSGWQYTGVRVKPVDSENPADFVKIDYKYRDGDTNGLKNGTKVIILKECESPSG